MLRSPCSVSLLSISTLNLVQKIRLLFLKIINSAVLSPFFPHLQGLTITIMETKANIFSFILKLVIRSTLKVQLSIFGIEVEEISYCIQLKVLGSQEVSFIIQDQNKSMPLMIHSVVFRSVLPVKGTGIPPAASVLQN